MDLFHAPQSSSTGCNIKYVSSSVIVKLEKFSFPTELDGNEERIFTFQFLFVEVVFVVVAFTLGGALETKTSTFKSIYDL